MKNIIFISFSFRPAHFEDTIKCYSGILNSNFHLSYYLCDDYYKYSEYFFRGKECYDCFSFFKQPHIAADTIVFIISPSRFNIRVTNFCKKNHIKTIYIFHEPYSTFLQYYKKNGSNFKKIIKSLALSFFNGKPFIRNVDGLIFPSKNAFHLFENNYKQLAFAKTNKLIVNILSEVAAQKKQLNKQYFSFIGTIDASRNFNLFVDYLLHSNNTQQHFLIASSKTIDESIKRRLIKKLGDRIHIHTGNRMSNEEIDSYYQQSFAVWLFYKNSTQSGVLMSSYRNGTPIIASNVEGITQHLVNGKTGFVIQKFNVEELDKDISFISENINSFSFSCIDYFNKNFLVDNFKKEIIAFFEGMVKN